MVAPLNWGAGLKGKVTQALAAGLPVVTTSIGAEGLDATDGREMLVADDDAELAERVIRALVDDDLWHSLAGTGRKLVDGICSPAVMRSTLAEILAAAEQPEWGYRVPLRQRASAG
jgi:glycosyltransferase involved in cell wall biosynthesis